MVDKTTIGGNGTNGELRVNDAANQSMVNVAVGTNTRRNDAELKIGGQGGRNGLLRVARAKDDLSTTIGDNGMSLVGALSVYNSDRRNPLNINPFGDELKVLMGDTGVAAYLQLTDGSNGPGPIIEVSGKDNAIRTGQPGAKTNTLEIVGKSARISAGGEGTAGRLIANGGDEKARVTLNGADASVRVGGNGSNGTVSVLGADGQPLLELLGRANESVMGLGQKNRPARISLYNAQQRESIKLDAGAGDILLANADAAEMFDVDGPAEPGTVMVISASGTLVAGDRPYDTRVAGIVSGAGTFQPALVLDRRQTEHDRAPIALAGKVYCYADASSAPIRAGDLLTTSATPGHAMRVGESSRALGAVVGKALGSLESGTGLIPVLVGLQ